MPPSILDAYKRRKRSPTNPQNQCEDCLFFNPFGNFCEHQYQTMKICDAFEDRKKDLLKKQSKVLGELPTNISHTE